ncbi:hypothetical protein R6Q57_012369 [Mikania cordata]
MLFLQAEEKVGGINCGAHNFLLLSYVLSLSVIYQLLGDIEVISVDILDPEAYLDILFLLWFFGVSHQHHLIRIFIELYDLYYGYDHLNCFFKHLIFYGDVEITFII